MLGEDELPDQLVCGLSVQGQGVAQRLQIGTLLQEGLLQTHAAGVEVLLREQTRDEIHWMWTRMEQAGGEADRGRDTES